MATEDDLLERRLSRGQLLRVAAAAGGASSTAGRDSSPVASSSASRLPVRSSTVRRHHERIVVQVPAGTASGSPVRVAVRPERVKMEAAGAPVPDGGSRLEGTVAEVVYLGMYTQFHVDTRAGRVVSHRLAEPSLAPLEAGSRVSLYWEPEQSSVLGDAVPEAT